MLTSIHLIRAACDATELSDAVVRGTANAARALCTWAADPSVPESTAAPVVTEAVHRVTSVLEHAESQHAHPPSACAMEELRTSLVELRSFLNEDSSEHSSVQSVASRGSDCQLIDREIVEKQNAAHTAAMHLRIIVVVLFVLVVGCTVAIVAIGISKMRDYESENRRLIISDLLTVAVSALDALYPLLQEAGVDVKYSGVAIAAGLLEELSSARGDMYSNQTMFFSSKSSLFEYRAGTQNFMQSGRVTAVTTPRTYGLLCRQNLSLPYKPEDDVSHDRTYILPDLTPNQCANDATAHGVFSGVTPPYTSFSPYVETYRRNGARLSNYYHQGFATSIAVTQDYETLQNFLVPSKTTFGTLDPFSNDFGDWKGYLTRWLALLLAGSLCLFLGAVELLTLLHFQHHRLLVAVILGGLVGGTLALAKTIVETSINNATSEMESTGAGEMCRCLAAALTSSTLEKYNAITSFYQQVAQSSLNGRVFFMFNDASSDNAILPSFMANTAKAINAASLNEERLAQDIGFANGYCYASFFYLAKEMFAVYVEEEDHQISANGAAWIASGAAVVALFFVLGYLRFSPLFKLAADGRGSPLLQRLGKQHVRLVLYIVMHVAIISSMAGLNAFGTTCVNSVTKDQASDTLEMLGSTNRAYSLVNNCQGSCGLPSTMTTLLFNLVNDAASLLYTYTPYPIYEGAWEDHYYGAQLALTRLPAVLQNMLSFATPLLNLTSGQIEPRYLQRRMLAAVDVNSTSGFVLERLPSSTLSPLFAFCSQSIGLCLGIGVVAIGVCAMEWIYTRMGRLCRERQSLRRSYAIMIGIVIVASLMVMVNAIIMKFEIHRAVEDFAEAELSLQCRSVNSRLEPITLNGYLKNLSPEAILDTIVAATLNASDNIQLGVSFYSRLRIFQEYPVFGSNRVLIRGGGLVANTTYPLPALTTSTVPQCASNMGEEFSATAPNRKLYCYSQLMTMMNETYKAPRMFIVAIREYDEVVANPAWTAWLQLIRVSATVCGVLIMFLLLVLWWTMDTAHRSGYALYGETEMASASLPWPRQFAVVDHRMPARRRLLWLACSVVGLMIVLMYYTVSLSELIDELDLANSLVVPYATQNGVSVSMTNTAMDDAYNYVRFPDEGGTSGVIAALANSVAAGTAQYQFSVPAYRDDYVAALNNMYNTITGATLVKSYAEQGLTASGFDSYSSLVANQYMNFIKAQTAVLELLLTLYSTLSIFLSPQENYPFYTDEVPAVLLYCELLTDVMQKLFVLDHMAVASFLEFTPTSSTNNDLCPFNSTPEEMATMVTNTQSAYALLVEQVDERIEALITASVVLMSTSSVLSVFSNTINNVKRTYPTAVALSNLAGPLWTSQGDRCQDVSFAGNASMEARVTSERESVLDDLVTQQDALIVAYAKDAAYRKSVQMIEFIDSGEDLSRMENVLAWERVRMANNVKHKVVVAFACTLSLFVVLVFVSGVWYWVQRNGVEQLLKSADEAAPLRRASKPYSEQDATDDGQTRGSIRLVLPFVIGALMAVIPICCAYWLMWKMLDKSVNTMPGVEVTAPYIALYQQTFVTDVEAFLVESSIQLQNSSLNAVKDSALLFALAFNSLYHEGADINSNITSSIAMFTQYGSEALACAKKEVYMNSIAVNVLNMKSYASSLTAYAREVLLTMDATDNYSLIVPVGVSGSTTVGSALSIELFTQALGLASHTQVTSTTLFDPYTKQIQTLNTASKAYLNMWHVVVSGAAKGGETVATTYWNFESLVGTAALQPLSTSGASSAAGAVTGITTFFAPLLAVATSETAVDTLFTTTTAVTTETGPVSSYLDAAYASSYLSSIVTAATVTNMYAYNRGLTTKSVELNGETPLITYLNNMISISEYLITTGLSNSYYTYTLQPATKNEWIWATEVTGIRTITSIYDEASYIDTAMQWCCVSAFWIIFLVAIFCAYKLLHLA